MNLLTLIDKSDVSSSVGMESYRFINENGLGGWILSKNNIQLSEELALSCRTTAIISFVRYETYHRELMKFLEVFPKAIAIKGMSLIPRIYQDPTLRCISDIDLYYPYHLGEVRNYFINQGFEIDDDKWEANQFKFVATKLIMGVEVPFEVHQKLLWKSEVDWQYKLDQQSSLQSLIPEDELVYLAGHLAYQHTMLSINWLIDIALILQLKRKWDQKRIDELLKKVPLSNSLSSCLWACEKYFKVVIPSELKGYIKKNFKNRLIQKLITQDFLMNPYQHRLSFYLLKHLFKDSFLSAILYDALWLKHVARKKLNHG